MAEVGEEEGWRFLYEALLRISSLRLLLTKDLVAPSVSCNRGLKASLGRFSSCLELVCEWQSERECGKRVVLRVPLPLCPVDHGAPVEAVAREDHIEVKLRMVSGGASFLLSSEMGMLPSTNESSELASRAPEIILGCRACKAAITRGGFESVLELPSVDWREATDDWFGVCCCGSSIRTESIVAGFEKNVTASHGKLLVGNSTCIVHASDLCQASPPVDSACDRAQEKEKSEAGALEVEVNGDTNQGNHRQHTSVFRGHQHDVCCEKNDCVTTREEHTSGPGFYDFLKGPVEPMNSGTWQPFNCLECSSLIGVFLEPNEGQTPKPAVHLFKRHILAAENTLTKESFRHHTLEKDFTKELVSRAEQDSSYRYVVRGLRLKRPMLQVVLVNENSLVFSGAVVDSKRQVSLGSFTPAASAMLQDCSEFEEHELTIVEEWCTRHNVDDIFLLEEEIAMLLTTIRANQEFYPASYSVNQGFRLSFLRI
ncbi:uncharacterized protein LOC112350074 [Selaginella moellendorffii]|uniref:uncharacterized protein LOC112350074 n=1 Tax=Selaginella moellendorffii TaxID=88036 RepID=UPI000D1C4F8D|nr:uncharacterized protein LOC112350074 [Selaginella moellendorffii]XP_024541408.1 uncharacterized protein LOC112350074 [Selaginella moellendorffii]|eukprot:XP_024541407.1 uncharacterized protein LOC112350074 [Selaginella moellendorffii]